MKAEEMMELVKDLIHFAKSHTDAVNNSFDVVFINGLVALEHSEENYSYTKDDAMKSLADWIFFYEKRIDKTKAKLQAIADKL